MRHGGSGFAGLPGLRSRRELRLTPGFQALASAGSGAASSGQRDEAKPCLGQGRGKPRPYMIRNF